jgi:hypothetical protein
MTDDVDTRLEELHQTATRNLPPDEQAREGRERREAENDAITLLLELDEQRDDAAYDHVTTHNSGRWLVGLLLNRVRAERLEQAERQADLDEIGGG